MSFRIADAFIDVDADLAKAEAKLRALGSKSYTVGINANTSQADAQLQATLALLGKISGTTTSTVNVNTNAKTAASDVNSLGSKLSEIGSSAAGISLVATKMAAISAAAVGASGAAAGLGAAFAGAGVATFAGLSGIGGAVTALGKATDGTAASAKAAQQAMAGLTPAGRAFATDMAAFISGPLEKLKATAQTNLMPGLESALKAITPMMGPITASIGTLSKTVGSMLGGLVPIIASLAKPFLDFSNAALQGLKPLEPILKTFAAQLGAVFEQLAKSGAVKQMMSAISGVVGALLPILPPLIQVGVQVMSILGPPLQVVIAALVTALKPVLAVMPTLAKAFGDILVALAPLLPPIGQLVAALASALSPVISALVPVISILVGAISQILKAVEPILPILGQALVQAIQAVAPLIGPLAQVFVQLVTALLPLLPVIVQLAAQIISALMPALAPLIPAILQLIQAFAPLIPVIAQLVTAIVGTLIPIITPLVQLLATIVAGGVELVAMFVQKMTPAIKLIAQWFQDLQEKYIRPAWAAIYSTISTTWNWIRDNVFSPIVNNIKTVGGWFSKLWTDYIKPAWDNIKSGLNTTWTWIKANVFDKLSSTVSGLGTLFDKARQAIVTAWDKVKDAAKTPVAFVVNSVMAPLANAWNGIIGKVNSSLMFPVPHMATGGKVFGPGSDTSDDVPTMLSRDEWVIRAKAARTIGDRGMAAINNADRLGLQVSGDPGSTVIKPRGYADGGKVAPIQSWLQGLTSTPYVWGGVGPSGYDCSGLTGEVWNRLTGHPSYRRVMTTLSDFASMGFKRGTGTYTIGVNSDHMVGNLGGLAFEAPHTGANIRVGSSAQSTSAVGTQWYLADYGAGPSTGGGGGFSPPQLAKDAAKTVIDKLTGGWWSKLGGLGFFGNAMVDVGKKLVSSIFDDGGVLQPGTSLVTNLSGKPEPVFSAPQWETLRSLVQQRSGVEPTPSGAATYTFHAGAITLDASKLKDISDLVAMIQGLTTTARAYGAAR